MVCFKLILLRFPQLATFVLIKGSSHLSLCVILDGLARLELLTAAFALAECDGCKFENLESALRHSIQLYLSNVPSASASILVSPMAALLWLIATLRASA
jgi:hypothetical protein